jgi:hypothetical protein
MLAVAVGIFAARSEALTDYYRVYGNSCYSITPGLMGEVSQHGLGNTTSAQGMKVACPVTIPEKNYTEGYLSFSGYDRSGNDNLSCTMNFSNNTGDVLNTVTSNTTGSGHGIKFGNGVRVTPTGAQKIMWITCRIPPTYDGWMSLLTSVYMTLNY